MSPQSSAETIAADPFRTDHLKTNLSGRAALGAVVTITTQGLRFVISLVATSVMARLLTPQDYGLIGMVAFVTGFVAMYKDLGLSVATIQKSEISSEQISTLFWVNVLLSVAITLFTAAISPLVAWFYKEPRLTWITVLTSLGFLISGLAVQHDALLRRQMRYFALATVGLTSVVVGYVAGIILAWRGFSYWALVGSQLALITTSTILTLIFCRWVPNLPRRRSGAASMIKFGGHLTGFTTINYFSRNLDNLLIGRFAGPQQLGFYSRAYQLMMLPIDQINEPITSVALPSLSRLVESPEGYRRAYLRMLEKIVMVTMPTVVFLIATSDWVIRIVLGSQWTGAVKIFVLLGITGLFQPVANTTGWLLLSQGRANDLFKWGLMSGPIIILSFLVGLPWGAVGVAASYACARILIVDPLLYWFVGRRGPVRTMDFYRTMAPFVMASFVAMLATLAFRKWGALESGFWTLLVSLVITAATTFITLAAMPAGRKALNDVRLSGLLLFNKKARLSS
jgi:PST family polysaccharide transporter